MGSVVVLTDSEVAVVIVEKSHYKGWAKLLPTVIMSTDENLEVHASAIDVLA